MYLISWQILYTNVSSIIGRYCIPMYLINWQILSTNISSLRIGGGMASVLVSSAVDRVFDPR